LKQLAAQIEKYKPEMVKQEHIFKERRLEIESITRLIDEIDKALNILPPDTLSDYKKNLKLVDRMEKRYSSLLNKFQALKETKVKILKTLEQEEANYKARNLQCQEEALREQEKVAEQKTITENLGAEIEKIEQSKKILQQQIAEEQLTAESLRNFEKELIGDKENVSRNWFWDIFLWILMKQI